MEIYLNKVEFQYRINFFMNKQLILMINKSTPVIKASIKKNYQIEVKSRLKFRRIIQKQIQFIQVLNLIILNCKWIT